MGFDDLQLQDQLGKGAFATVFKARDQRTDRVYAVKVGDVDSLEGEADLLRSIDSPYILPCVNVTSKGNMLWVVLEYCEGGCLLDAMDEGDCFMEEREIAAVMRMVVSGLAYIHQRGIIHRDIKASNLLLTRHGVCKIGDFGVATERGEDLNQNKAATITGSPYWMAPEVVANTEPYNEKADIWSVGITCIELATGNPPLYQIHPMKALFLIPSNPSPSLPGGFSSDFSSFVDACLNKDPTLRPTAEELLKHPFLTQVERGQKSREIIRGFLRRCTPDIFDADEEESSDLDEDDREQHPERLQLVSPLTSNSSLNVAQPTHGVIKQRPLTRPSGTNSNINDKENIPSPSKKRPLTPPSNNNNTSGDVPSSNPIGEWKKLMAAFALLTKEKDIAIMCASQWRQKHRQQQQVIARQAERIRELEAQSIQQRERLTLCDVEIGALKSQLKAYIAQDTSSKSSGASRRSTDPSSPLSPSLSESHEGNSTLSSVLEGEQELLNDPEFMAVLADCNDFTGDPN